MKVKKVVEPEGYPPFLARHQGLFTTRDVDRLYGATVAIAGVGGVGGRLAEVLARSGVGSLRLADPDIFSVSNLNRQAGSSHQNLGEKKVDVISALCRSVSPLIKVETYEEGVTEENLKEFVAGAEIVVDGIDFTKPALSLALIEEATRLSIPVVMGVEIAFGAWHTVINDPASFKQLLGIPHHVSIDDLQAKRWEVPLWRWIGSLPPYTEVGQMVKLVRGKFDAPAIAPAVELSAALLSTDVLRLLLRKQPVALAPRVHAVDLVTGRAKTLRPSRTRFFASVVRAAVGGWK